MCIRDSLRVLARTNGIPRSRVDEVIEIVGLTEVANHRVGSFSMGMGQRVGIAAALLGDPQTVILDEPANGLDPEGILWIRNLMKALAPVSYTHLRAHETVLDLVCRLLLEKKK